MSSDVKIKEKIDFKYKQNDNLSTQKLNIARNKNDSNKSDGVRYFLT